MAVGGALPQPTNVPAGGANMGRLYVWGGGNPVLMEPWSTGALHQYDPALNTWTVLCPMNVARSFVAGTFVGDMAFAAGGFSDYETTAAMETFGEVGPPPPPPPPEPP